MDSLQVVTEPIASGASPTIPGTWRDLALYVFGGFGLFFIASLVVGSFFLEINLLLTTIAIGLNIIFIGGAPYIFGILRNRLSWVELGIKPVVWRIEYVLIVVLGTYLLMPLRAALGILFQYLIEGGMDSMLARNEVLFPGGLTFPGVAVVGLGAGILAPIAEEFYFRGLLQGWLRQRMGGFGAVLISSLLFGLAHFDSPGVAMSAFIMGLAMGYVYDRTRSLWVPIGMHVLTNTTAVILGVLAIWLQEALGLPGL